MYAFLARLFDVPEEDTHKFIADGSLLKFIDEVKDNLPFDLKELGADLKVPKDFLEFQSDFISFFEVGQKGPVCPLYESSYKNDKGRKSIYEDLLRFYNHFEIKMSENARELPDLLSAELEFMHYLSFLETGQLEESGPNGPRMDLLRAQKDFLSRHLADWLKPFSKKAKEKGVPKPYDKLIELLGEYVESDLSYIKKITEK